METNKNNDHILLALWAAECAKHVLSRFEDNYPEDFRPRNAIEATRAWVQGRLKVSEARRFALAAHAAACEAVEPESVAAARSAGHAAATTHVVDHAKHAASYAIKASANPKSEQKWQQKRLPIILTLILFMVMVNPSYSLENGLPGIKIDNSTLQDSGTINKARLITVVSGVSVAYFGSMAYLQYIWYKDHERVPFHYYNDFKGYNQIDKFGHVYGAYLESYIGFHSLLWAGVPRRKAVLYGGGFGFLLQLPIEIWDGMYEGWGFSWSDVAANTIGSALVVGQELAFGEQIVKYKLSFYPSLYAKQANGYLGEGINQFMYDYNGHTNWLSVGVNRIIRNEKIPDWINVAVGYGAGGMFGEFENKTSYKGVEIPETERFRQFLFSFDVDFSKIPARNKNLKKLLNSFFMIKVPFPTVEFNTKGQLRFYPLYY